MRATHAFPVLKRLSRLLMFLLKAHRPQKFRDGGEVKHTGAIDVSVDGDIEERILEKLERLDDEANE